MDDRAARKVARQRNLIVIGTLGVLAEAAEHGLTDFSDAVARLQQTSFYISPEVLKPLLRRYRKKR
jgi:predicted nucleic acid-binding protein